MKGIFYFSPLPLIEAEETQDCSNSQKNLLHSEMAFQFRRGRGRGGSVGKPIANAEVMEEMGTLHVEVEAIRNAGRRDPEASDVSEVEQEDNTK
jgi:hypothetical protein